MGFVMSGSCGGIVFSVFMKDGDYLLSEVTPRFGGAYLHAYGVDVDNILTVSSNPRCKRLAEVLQKTGLVERSGQGVDKMFRNSILDGKELPSFEGTDYYQVQLVMAAKVKYPKLAKLTRVEQEKRGEVNPLTVFDLVGLYHVNRGEVDMVPEGVMKHLQDEGVVQNVGGEWVIRGGNDLPNDPLNDPLNDLPNDPLIVDPNYTGIQYTKRQSKIVDLVCKNYSITREELAKRLSVSVATIKREMKVVGYQWEGHSTKGHWVKRR